MIIPERMPFLRMRAMIASRSGCSSGSPPLMVTTAVPKFAEAVDAAQHFSGVHRLREIVEFVAIRAGQIAAADRNDVHQQRMPRGRETLGEHASSRSLRCAASSFRRIFLRAVTGFQPLEAGLALSFLLPQKPPFKMLCDTSPFPLLRYCSESRACCNINSRSLKTLRPPRRPSSVVWDYSALEFEICEPLRWRM